MKVLVACEESQEVCKAFRARGHEAYSCDVQECSGGHPEWHILGDALEAVALCGGGVTTMDKIFHPVDKWDLLIAHPPCTYLSNAGAKHLFRGKKLNIKRYYYGLCGKALFMAFLKADVNKIAVENPVPSKIFEMPKYTQIIQPFMFGHAVTKKTLLWLKGLPELVPTNIVQPQGGSCHDAGSWFNVGGKERQKNRSKTFRGIAEAMAEQWGKVLGESLEQGLEKDKTD